MISYAPLWKTMERQGETIYTLRSRDKDETISGSTILRLQKNQFVSTNTLNTLCKILGCKLTDVAEYLPD